MKGGPQKCEYCVAAVAAPAGAAINPPLRPVPFPDERQPRMIEVECVKIQSFDVTHHV